MIVVLRMWTQDKHFQQQHQQQQTLFSIFHILFSLSFYFRFDAVISKNYFDFLLWTVNEKRKFNLKCCWKQKWFIDFRIHLIIIIISYEFNELWRTLESIINCVIEFRIVSIIFTGLSVLNFSKYLRKKSESWKKFFYYIYCLVIFTIRNSGNFKGMSSNRFV